MLPVLLLFILFVEGVANKAKWRPPVVSLAQFRRGGEARKAMVDVLRHACEDTGCFRPLSLFC